MTRRIRRSTEIGAAVVVAGCVLIVFDAVLRPFVGHALILTGIAICLVGTLFLRLRLARMAERFLRQTATTVQDTARRDRETRAALDDLVQLCATTTGPDFFESMARQLGVSCGVDLVAISELGRRVDPPGTTARMLAFVADGRTQPGMSYDLRGTPCEGVVTTGFCHYDQGVSAKFPDDLALTEHRIESYMAIVLSDRVGSPIGLITLLHRMPIRDPRAAERALRAIAGRAGAELQRAIAERSLRESEARLQAMLTNSPGVAAQWYDHDGRVILWSRGSESMFGYTEAEALGRTLDQLIFTPLQGAEFLDSLGSIAETGEALGPLEFPFRRRDGSTGVCLSTIFAIPGEHQSRWFVCMDVDISRLRRAEEELRQSQKLRAIGQLAGGVAHDFNNLLFIINGYGEMLLRELPADSRAHRQCLESMLEAGRRAANLTRQLLTFGRRQVVDPRVVDLNAELQQLRPTLRELIDGRASLRYELCPGPHPIRIDPTQLQQVLMNLVVNARDAMPSGGTITVRTNRADGDAGTTDGAPGPVVRLAVHDLGVGMSREVQDRIFEPFFTTKQGKGTGLGLATVYGAVQESGGSIAVESREGAGATFTITWPLARTEAGAAAPAAERREAGGTESILFAEDDPSVRRLVTKHLRDLGYTVHEASSGDEALRLAARGDLDVRLLLTDLTLGDMHGRALAARIRETRPNLPTVFISGHTDDEGFRREAGAAGGIFLQKPFSFASLAKATRSAIDGTAETASMAGEATVG